MKKVISVVLSIVILLVSVTACSSVQNQNSTTATKDFTDSCGRTVSVPAQINSIAVTGGVGQIIIFALAPDKLVGTAIKWSDNMKKYIDEKYQSLPVLGQLYGSSGELNLEELLKVNPQVIIDIGEAKSSIANDMDELQNKVGLPVVHIDAYLSSYDQTYSKLGELLDMQEDAKALGDYCTEAYNLSKQASDSTQKAEVLYVLGENGTNILAKGSYHSEVIDLLCDNIAVVDNPSSKGTGNEVDMEQIIKWNPKNIIFAPDSIYDTVGDNELWKDISAIKNKQYYLVPSEPYNWMGSPPSVQRILGMLWTSATFYPDKVQYNLYEKTKEYFKLFYHCDLSYEQYSNIVANG